MKIDSYLLDENKVLNNFISEKISFFKNPTGREGNLSPLQVKKTGSDKEDSGKANFLSIFWNKLIKTPQSYIQKPNTDISKILSEENGLCSNNLLSSVLSNKLEIPENSSALKSALEKCNKIFHEDFPGDFVLEYSGDRLGMFLVDICYDSQGNSKLLYRFRPEIKNFRGLF